MMIDGVNYSVCRDFPDLMQDIIGKTMLGVGNLRMLYQMALSVKRLPGLVAEMGVWKGGTLYLLASVLTNSAVYGFDSWEGLPEALPQDIVPDGLKMRTAPKGWGRTIVPDELFASFENRVKLVKGWFADTLLSVESEQFRLVHVDCDRYQSVKECFEFFDTRMVDGGLISYHDYSFYGTPGAKIAVNECLPTSRAKKFYGVKGVFVLEY